MKEFSVLIPTCRTDHLAKVVIQSFEKFKPEDCIITYVVVENSNEGGFKAEAEKLADNVIWVQNPTNSTGSIANGVALEAGKPYITTEWTFLCHADIAVASKDFFTSFFKKIEEGNVLIGVTKDLTRIQAARQSGIFVRTDILQNVDTMPQLPEMDVGDSLTKYCRDNNLDWCVFRNTDIDSSLCELLNEPYKTWGPNCGVDRCLNDDNNVIMIHLGRGDLKCKGGYHKSGKKTFNDWVEICKELLD